LPRFKGKGKDLTLYAPPPLWFTSTLEALKLNYDFELLKERDKINHWTAAQPRMKQRPAEIEVLPAEESSNFS